MRLPVFLYILAILTQAYSAIQTLWLPVCSSGWLPGSAWLVERGGCTVVHAALPRWRQEAVNARQSAMDGLVQAEEAAATKCAAAP